MGILICVVCGSKIPVKKRLKQGLIVRCFQCDTEYIYKVHRNSNYGRFTLLKLGKRKRD